MPDSPESAEPTRVVLDGSVALAWHFEDEADPYADAVAARVPELEFVVPSIWGVEVANAVLVGERRGRADRVQAEAWKSRVTILPLVMDIQDPSEVLGATLELARLHNLSAYDASYLELAIRRNLPLATLDKKLRAAAQTSGVTIFSP